MISDSDRVLAVKLINQARVDGARLAPACAVLNISETGPFEKMLLSEIDKTSIT